MNKGGGTIIQQKKAITMHSTNAQGSCYFGPSIKSLIRKDSLSLNYPKCTIKDILALSPLSEKNKVKGMLSWLW